MTTTPTTNNIPAVPIFVGPRDIEDELVTSEFTATINDEQLAQPLPNLSVVGPPFSTNTTSDLLRNERSIVQILDLQRREQRDRIPIQFRSTHSDLRLRLPDGLKLQLELLEIPPEPANGGPKAQKNQKSTPQAADGGTSSEHKAETNPVVELIEEVVEFVDEVIGEVVDALLMPTESKD